MDSVLPFWLEHSQDKTYGGYFSCLDRDGSVYDTDKFIWAPGPRGVALLDALQQGRKTQRGVARLRHPGRRVLSEIRTRRKYDWYFSLTREGKPIIDPYNIFSYTFATMAFAQLAMASETTNTRRSRRRHSTGILENARIQRGVGQRLTRERDRCDFALPMILCNLALEIEQLIDPKLIEETIDVCPTR